MKIIFLNCCSVIVTFSFAIVLSAQGQTNRVHYQRTIALLNNIEREMDKHYIQIEQDGQFEDPLGRIDFWFKTVQSQAPELFVNTSKYKKDLISCLMDSSIKKNVYTDLDIVYILYNLCLDEYIEMIDTMCVYHKNGLINFSILENLVIQDFNVSNRIAKNYQDRKVENCLSNIIAYFESQEIDSKLQILSFLEILKDIKSGEDWEDIQKYAAKLQPPILDRLKIDCK